MELKIENDLNTNLELEQSNFLDTVLGQAIDNGIDIGIRYLLPDYLEDKIIELKDNMIKYGLQEGFSQTIKSTIDTGKSIIGIFTGNFENVNQINEAIKKGGVIDSVSNILDEVLDKLKSSGKVNGTMVDIIKNGKETILNNVEKNIENTMTKQNITFEKLQENINNWKDFYNSKDFKGMEKEYKKIKAEIKELIPFENTINSARTIENLHLLIKNNGQDFNITSEEIELAEKLKL